MTLMQALADAEWDMEQELASSPTVTCLMLVWLFYKYNTETGGEQGIEYNLNPGLPGG